MSHDPALRRAGAAVRAKGFALITVGVIHTVALCFMVAPQALRELPGQWAVDLCAWFGIAGVFFLFMGSMDLSTAPGVRRGERDAWRTALVSGLFAASAGSLGVSLWHDQVAAIFPGTIMLSGFLATAALLRARARVAGEQPRPSGVPAHRSLAP